MDLTTGYVGTHAELTPSRPAVLMAGTGEIVTYAELDARSNRLARLLRSAGLRRGDRIAVLLENHPRYLEVVWAALRSGLYITPVNSHLNAQEAAYIVDDCGASALVTSAALHSVVSGMDATALRSVHLQLMMDGTVDGFDSYEHALRSESADRLEDESCGTYLFYSSGTTGRPKGILHALRDGSPAVMDDRHARLGVLYGHRPGMRYLSPAPLYHAAPLGACVNVGRHGGTVVVMERFDPSHSLGLIERHRITHSQWVPTMFVRMLKLPDAQRIERDLSSHEVAIHASAPCPVDVKQRMIDWWGPILHEYYAGSEQVGVTYINSQEWLRRPGSVGRPRSGRVHVVDDAGVELPPGTVGNVCFSGGPPVEYLGDPDKTAAAHFAGGMATMGDLGYLDDAGWLYLTDRKADTVITGGVNVYPAEAEAVLLRHPAVADAAVFGIPDEDLGESVAGAVELVAGTRRHDTLGAELVAFTREHLASFKCPRSVEIVDQLPRTPAGKLLRRQLREQHAHRLTTT